MSKTKAIANDIVGNTNTQRFLFKILFASILSLSIVYIYMIGSITFNVVARKSLEAESRITGSRISKLELIYLNKMNDVNKAYAKTLGFVNTESNIFAIRTITHVAIR